MRETEERWRVWWRWGIPIAWLASILVLAAESARNAGYESGGALLDVARLAVYWWWMRLAWKCSRNVDQGWWTPLSRAVLALGLVANVMI